MPKATDDQTTCLQVLYQMFASIRETKISELANAIERLTPEDLQQLTEAARLIRGFINNL